LDVIFLRWRWFVCFLLNQAPDFNHGAMWEGEDPSIWIDSDGHYHMVSHNGNRGQHFPTNTSGDCGRFDIGSFVLLLHWYCIVCFIFVSLLCIWCVFVRVYSGDSTSCSLVAFWCWCSSGEDWGGPGEDWVEGGGGCTERTLTG
jgi:hypothetical protein